ncbi:MAG TPA: hypothetical protein VFT45_02155, partial [Longimicrobium sp.]|nr:hypothetical protein [Longimicrobium sp.]
MSARPVVSRTAPPSLFVISLPRSLSSHTYQVARTALGLAEPAWTSDGEVLNSDRFVLHGGPGHDEGKKYIRPGPDGAAGQLCDFLDQLVQPAGFAYKDVVQPFVVSRWLTAAPRGVAVLRIRRPLADVALSMLQRGWFYPARGRQERPGEPLETALLRGLMEAEAALDAVPAVEVEYDALVRDEAALADALRRLAPDRPLAEVRYADAGFRRIAGARLARRR